MQPGRSKWRLAMTRIFTVNLTGSQEVPSNSSAAGGGGTVIWDEGASTGHLPVQHPGPAISAPRPGRARRRRPPPTSRQHAFPQPVPRRQWRRRLRPDRPAQDADDLRVTQNADGSWTVTGAWERTDPATVPVTDFARGAEPDPHGVGRPAVLQRPLHRLPGRRDPRPAGFGRHGGRVRSQRLRCGFLQADLSGRGGADGVRLRPAAALRQLRLEGGARPECAVRHLGLSAHLPGRRGGGGEPAASTT